MTLHHRRKTFEGEKFARPRAGRPTVAYLLALVFALPLGAQAPAADIDAAARRATATRHEIDSLAAVAEAAAAAADVTPARRDELQQYAIQLRARLREGDFKPGDRIVVALAGDSIRSDTLTVQPSRTLVLPRLPPLQLDGVLRSELHARLAEQLRPYVKDSLLRASPLVLVGVLGEVAHPGYYRLPLEIPVGEALMAAGGPTPQADLTRVTVRRGNTTLVAAPSVREAMIRGVPLARLGMDAGDELVVLAPRTRNWGTLLQIGGLATGLVLALRSLSVF